MLQTFSPIIFTLLAALLGGWVFSKEPEASLEDICEGGVLFGGILGVFFVCVAFV